MISTAELGRRRALKQLLAAAGTAALASRVAGGQTATAPLGDAAPLTDLGMALDAEQRAAGAAFLQRHVSVDIHSHPGRFFLKNVVRETPVTRAFGAPFEEQAVADLRAGHATATLISAVADMALLELTPAGGLHAAREFEPGEAYAEYERQRREVESLIRRHALAPGRDVSDLRAAQHTQKTAAIFAVEGGDFIEGRLDRVHSAFRAGVRAVTLVHYHVNQIGDIQTEAPVHQGLTPLGKSIVAEMNAAGVIIDLAHASFASVRDAAAVSAKPMMISHSNLVTPLLSHPRLITVEHAKLVTEAGGIIGSWPSGLGQATFSDYIDSIRRLVDAVGIDHVAIGTDMDANYKPVLRSYRDWSLLPAALLARGLREDETAKIMGENFLRVFGANLARTPARVR